MLEKYSIGTGDRFGEQGVAQLAAVEKAKEQGITITPVWNKSYREHTMIGTKPENVRKEADHAVKELNWPDAYYVDADHINIHSVDDFLESSDFFTIDVADYIGEPAGNGMHCSYKIAAEQGADFIKLLRGNSRSISSKVTENLFDRHIAPLFLGS